MGKIVCMHLFVKTGGCFLILQLFSFSLLLLSSGIGMQQLQALIITLRVPGRERGPC